MQQQQQLATAKSDIAERIVIIMRQVFYFRTMAKITFRSCTRFLLKKRKLSTLLPNTAKHHFPFSLLGIQIPAKHNMKLVQGPRLVFFFAKELLDPSGD